MANEHPEREKADYYRHWIDESVRLLLRFDGGGLWHVAQVEAGAIDGRVRVPLHRE